MDANDRDILPSNVTDARFLFWPPGSDDLEIEEGGKWMVFLDGNFERLDGYWNALRPLCGENGILYKIRSTTQVDKEGGLINCYTRNADDKDDVIKAALAIDEAIQIHTVKTIYYKTKRATDEGQFRNMGKTKISKYKFTTEQEVFESVSSRWRRLRL